MITSKSYFNPNGCNILDEKIWEPENTTTGFVDFNRDGSRSSFATKIYKKQMIPLTWFVDEVNTSSEKKSYSILSDNEKEIYKHIFSGLSFLDSAQEEHILDFRRMANSRIVKSVLTRQAWEEVNHQESYATLLDAVGNSTEVFDMYKNNDILMTKNQRVAEMFSRHINGRDAKSMAMSSLASINLEGLFFLTSFAQIFSIGDKVPGARDTLSFIAKDEILSHLPVFANIFKSITRENKLNIAGFQDEVYRFMEEAIDIETEYSGRLIREYPTLGITQDKMIDTVNNYANNRLVAMGMEKIFPESPTTNMQKLVTKHLEVNNVKSNFFESNNKGYSKGSIDMDF